MRGSASEIASARARRRESPACRRTRIPADRSAAEGCARAATDRRPPPRGCSRPNARSETSDRSRAGRRVRRGVSGERPRGGHEEAMVPVGPAVHHEQGRRALAELADIDPGIDPGIDPLWRLHEASMPRPAGDSARLPSLRSPVVALVPPPTPARRYRPHCDSKRSSRGSAGTLRVLSAEGFRGVRRKTG